jgi:hypothetical protein
VLPKEKAGGAGVPARLGSLLFFLCYNIELSLMKTKTPEQKSRKWLYVRRGSQILFLVLFLFLFLKAEYRGQDVLAWPVDLFFRFDPLILAAHLLTFSPLIWGLFWSLSLWG